MNADGTWRGNSECWVSLDFDRFIAKCHSVWLKSHCIYFLFLIPLSKSVSPLLDVSGTTLVSIP